jgi:hypothetical protein
MTNDLVKELPTTFSLSYVDTAYTSDEFTVRPQALLVVELTYQKVEPGFFKWLQPQVWFTNSLFPEYTFEYPASIAVQEDGEVIGVKEDELSYTLTLRIKTGPITGQQAITVRQRELFNDVPMTLPPEKAPLQSWACSYQASPGH